MWGCPSQSSNVQPLTAHQPSVSCWDQNQAGNRRLNSCLFCKEQEAAPFTNRATASLGQMTLSGAGKESESNLEVRTSELVKNLGIWGSDGKIKIFKQITPQGLKFFLRFENKNWALIIYAPSNFQYSSISPSAPSKQLI